LCLHLCLLTIDGWWWALTALDSVSRLFSQCSRPWVALTDLGDVVVATHLGASLSLGVRRRWCRSWVVCCRPAVVVAWSSSVVVVVVVSHRCHQSWLLTWCSCIVRMVYQRVQVVVGGGQWCGDDGWVSWVGVVSGHCGWWWVVVVVVEEEGGCCLLTCLLMPKSSIGKRRC